MLIDDTCDNEPYKNREREPMKRFSRANYGSGGDDDWASKTQVSRWPDQMGTRYQDDIDEFDQYGDLSGYDHLVDASYVNEEPNAYISSYPEDGYAEFDDGYPYDDAGSQYPSATSRQRAPGMSDGVSPVSSRPTKTVKKHHPVRNVFLVLLAIVVAFGIFNLASWAAKDESAWAKEYSGTWQMKASDGVGNPIISFGATFLASSNTELGKQMLVGIYDSGAQMQSFGTVKDYGFSYDKSHFVLSATDGSGELEGDLRFGFLFLSNADGSTTIYERTSETYDPISPETASFDAEALVATLKGLAGQVGVDPSALDAIDTDALSEQLSGLSPETIQEAINSVDISKLANGSTEDTIDMSSPAVNEIIQAIDPSQLIDEGAESAGNFLNGTDIDLDATPEDLTQSLSDLWNQSTPSDG